MGVDLRVEGADDFQRVARELREVGDVELRRELYRGIERAVKPLKEAARDAARQRLPHRGGLAEKVAKSKFSTRRRSGRDPGIKIVAKDPIDLASIDRGRLRHPVFGNRRVWVNQSVPAGWFTDAMEKGAADVRRELLEVLGDVEKKLARRHG